MNWSDLYRRLAINAGSPAFVRNAIIEEFATRNGITFSQALAGLAEYEASMSDGSAMDLEMRRRRAAGQADEVAERDRTAPLRQAQAGARPYAAVAVPIPSSGGGDGGVMDVAGSVLDRFAGGVTAVADLMRRLVGATPRLDAPETGEARDVAARRRRAAGQEGTVTAEVWRNFMGPVAGRPEESGAPPSPSPSPSPSQSQIMGPVLGRDEESGRPPGAVPGWQQYAYGAMGQFYREPVPPPYDPATSVTERVQALREPGGWQEYAYGDWDEDDSANYLEAMGSRLPEFSEGLAQSPSYAAPVIDTKFLAEALEGNRKYMTKLRSASEAAVLDYTVNLQSRRNHFWDDNQALYAQAGVASEAAAGQQEFARVQDPFVYDALLLNGYSQQEIDSIGESVDGYFKDIQHRMPIIQELLAGRIGVATAEIDRQAMSDAIMLEEGRMNQQMIADIYAEVDSYEEQINRRMAEAANQLERDELATSIFASLPPEVQQALAVGMVGVTQ